MDAILNAVAALPLVDWLHEIFREDIAKQTIAFLIAASLHRRWVKKDMAEQFALLRGAIDHVSEALGVRIQGLEERIKRVEEKP